MVWIVDPGYRGPLLVRGRQVDGPNEVRFERGSVPPREVRVVARGQRFGKPSSTRLRAAGCYAHQVDGTTFSRVIVDEARIVTQMTMVR